MNLFTKNKKVVGSVSNQRAVSSGGKSHQDLLLFHFFLHDFSLPLNVVPFLERPSAMQIKIAYSELQLLCVSVVLVEQQQLLCGGLPTEGDLLCRKDNWNCSAGAGHSTP